MKAPQPLSMCCSVGPDGGWRTSLSVWLTTPFSLLHARRFCVLFAQKTFGSLKITWLFAFDRDSILLFARWIPQTRLLQMIRPKNSEQFLSLSLSCKYSLFRCKYRVIIITLSLKFSNVRLFASNCCNPFARENFIQTNWDHVRTLDTSKEYIFREFVIGRRKLCSLFYIFNES